MGTRRLYNPWSRRSKSRCQGTSLNKHTSRRGLRIEPLEARVLLIGPQLIGVNPNTAELLNDGDVLNVAPQELTFRFDENQQIDPDSLDGIQISRSGLDGNLDDGNNVTIHPGFIGIGESSNEVVFRFAEALPDDIYRIEIFGTGPTPLTNVNGEPFDNGPDFGDIQDLVLGFELDLGPQVVAVVPQPITRPTQDTRIQDRDEIVVYFNNDNLDSTAATNREFYQLIFTNHTVTNRDDTVHRPISVNYDPVTDTARLKFAGAIDTLSGPGTYRLRIGTAEGIPEVPLETTITVDPGSSFDTADTTLGELGSQGRILSSSIDPQPFLLDLPGSDSDPGHRKIDVFANRHLLNRADVVDGVSEFAYNFQPIYLDTVGIIHVNVITERQKERAREIFEIYSQFIGVQFVETEDQGFTIVTGLLQAVDPSIQTDLTEEVGIAGEIEGFGPTAIMRAGESWNNDFGENWFREALRQIGHLLGLGDTFDLPEGTTQGADPRLTFLRELAELDPDLRLLKEAEPVFPGDHDIVHGQHLHRPDSNDIDLYRFSVTDAGSLTAEVIAERRLDSSLLDTVLRLYHETATGRELIAQNDDYFSEDSFIQLELVPGDYYIGVSASGNDAYDPVIENTGFGGLSQGPYDLRLGFRSQLNTTIVDTTGTPLDGDADGIAGGEFNFWFQAQTVARTIYVDKSFTGSTDGSLANPFNHIPTALAAASSGDIVRIMGNGGADGNLATVDDNLAYQIGFGSLAPELEDGRIMNVPQGVTVMIDAGAVFKLRRTHIMVGSSTPTIDRSEAVLQVLGTPQHSVLFTSADPQPSAGDWGGIIFRTDIDLDEGRFVHENEGIFLNYVNQADMRFGGGRVEVDSIQQVVAPIQMLTSRPTISFNVITDSANEAMSANPDSFQETTFHTPEFQVVSFHAPELQADSFTYDYNRVGPDIHNNQLVDNTTNGLFVRIRSLANNQFETMTVSGRWDDADIVHVVTEGLVIRGTAGGPLEDPDTLQRRARLDARLSIDPGTVVKLEGSRIETEMGATFYAEGTAARRVVLTSLGDDRFGSGGTFDTNNDMQNGNGGSDPQRGDWAGIFIGHLGTGSIDHAVIAYGGGITTIEGSATGINPVEFHQATGRVTRSVLENNARGVGGLAPDKRFGRGFNMPGTIFVRGAQPIIVDNIFRGNDSPTININANSLNHFIVADHGRSTGRIERIEGFGDNQGPLIRRNLVGNNRINGLQVRGGTLTTEAIWDDADMVHVLRDTIFVPDFHSYGGLRLESNSAESLVVKLLGENAGFTATGRPLETDDRIGGRVHIVGQPGKPVVLSSLTDDTVGAGFGPQGEPQSDTDNGGRPVRSEPKGSFKIDLNFGPNIAALPHVMEAAHIGAHFWEEIIEDPITVVFDFELAALGGALGGAASDQVSLDFNTVRRALIDDAGPHEPIVAQLPEFDDFEVLLPNDALNPFTLEETMSLTRANAKALGFPDGSLPGVPSQFDVDEMRDANIEFTNDLIIWDFDRKDGILPKRFDFIGTVIHEIGHALGFISAVDDVDFGLSNPEAAREIQVNPLDLFRLTPGAGVRDFPGAPRQLDPRFNDHVFYDGGVFDPTGIPIEQIEIGEIPLSQGSENGDGSQGSHWKDDALIDGIVIGVMDPTASIEEQPPVEDIVDNIMEADRLAFDRIGWNIVGGGGPGDWQGIRLEQYSHDRNVRIVNEQELSVEAAPGINFTPDTAQFVGNLAPHHKAADDNFRLGFEVHGFINEPGDVDVYSFQGEAGTEVWLDIDRTTMVFDSVVELVNANGTVLARSDNSVAEANGTESLVGMLDPQPMGGFDHYTTNERDAGMRVVLPGVVGVQRPFHVRVRSSSPDLDADIFGGLTSGQYQLQIRLQTADEFAGSSIEFADIRFANIGVNIIGLPNHSPLAGEFVEDESYNDLLFEGNENILDDEGMPTDEFIVHAELPVHIGPQNLGNLLNSDRAALSVFGNLSEPSDVDWYEFHVSIDAVQDIAGVTNQIQRTAGVVFDIDFADGLSRANTVLSVYNRFGELILFSDDANVVDDLPDIFNDDTGVPPDLTDLSRGSLGLLDPYIGPVELDAGFIDDVPAVPARSSERFDFEFPFFSPGTYFVAISSVAMLPEDIESGAATLSPIVGGVTNRGQKVVGSSSYEFVPNFSVGATDILTGEYQLEIRYTPVPDGGFDITNVDLADKNRERDQGQVIIDSTSISDSLEWGIVVEDGLRDLPVYEQDWSFLQFTRQPHAQYTNGDYLPHNGAARSLIQLNEERLVPGLTIKNNVIANNIEGGIHFQGDPNGFVMRTYDLITGDDPPRGLIPTAALLDLELIIEARTFTIRDIHGEERTFEFDSDGAVRPGNILVRFDLDPANDTVHNGRGSVLFPQPVNPPTLATYVASEIIYAIETTSLDVNVYRGEDDTFFIEGAIRINAGGAITNTPEPPNTESSSTPEGSALVLGDLPLISRHVAQQGPVPFGRIVNNTIVGRGGDLLDPPFDEDEEEGISRNRANDIGILVEDNASPTILNNIVANFATGLQADPSSRDLITDRRTFIGGAHVDAAQFQPVIEFTAPFIWFSIDDIDIDPTKYVAPRPTVIEGSIYQGNLFDIDLLSRGDFAIELTNEDPLFVDPQNGNYLLAEGSLAIDSSIDKLLERNDFEEITSAVGIAPSPILAPDFDLRGQLRVDDPSVEPPFGIGENPFNDRGALDRVDFAGPVAALNTPKDNDPQGNDQDPALTSVALLGGTLSVFEFLLADGVPPADPAFGTGIDDLTVTTDSVTVTRDGVPLVAGFDYSFGYNTTSDIIRLTALAGIWEPGSVYVIQLSDIEDLAGNPLKPNQPTDETQFTIALQRSTDFGDAPDPSFPTLLDSNGARHDIVPGFFLGGGVSPELDGRPNSEATGDDLDDGVEFTSALIPGATATLTVTASTSGFLDAWIDFDGDQVWDDPGDNPIEHVFDRQLLEVGANTLNFSVPAGTLEGITYARFRLSSNGGLAPTGEAIDGEVEDYRIFVGGSPWQNPQNRFDTNANGLVSAVDVVKVINDINAKGARALPIPPVAPDEPPPFVDVNGDGFVSAHDVLSVINFINAQSFNAATSRTVSASQSPQATFIASAAFNVSPVEMMDQQRSSITFDRPGSGTHGEGKENLPNSIVAHREMITPLSSLPEERMNAADWETTLDRVLTGYGLQGLDTVLPDIAQDVGEAWQEDVDES